MGRIVQGLEFTFTFKYPSEIAPFQFLCDSSIVIMDRAGCLLSRRSAVRSLAPPVCM